jgi:hypothetical protein
MGRKKRGATIVQTKTGLKGKVVGEQFGKFQIELLSDTLEPVLDEKGQPKRILARTETVKTIGFFD